MIPAQKNKLDVSKLSPEEKARLGKYGDLPKRSLPKAARMQERKYFDSGDYALSKAGKKEEVGQSHPSPDTIPHHLAPPNAAAPAVEAAVGAAPVGNPLLRRDQQLHQAPPQRLTKPGPINAQVGRSRLGSGPTSPLAQSARSAHPLAQDAAEEPSER